MYKAFLQNHNMQRKTKIALVLVTLGILLFLIIYTEIIKFDFSNQYENTNLYRSNSYLQSINKFLKIKPKEKQILVLNFWETWCQPCRNELPLLNELKEQYRDCSNITFIGISKDDSLKIDQLKKTRGISLDFIQYCNIEGLRSELRSLYFKDSTIVDIVPITILINDHDSILNYTEGALSEADIVNIKKILTNSCYK